MEKSSIESHCLFFYILFHNCWLRFIEFRVKLLAILNLIHENEWIAEIHKIVLLKTDFRVIQLYLIEFWSCINLFFGIKWFLSNKFLYCSIRADMSIKFNTKKFLFFINSQPKFFTLKSLKKKTRLAVINSDV